MHSLTAKPVLEALQTSSKLYSQDFLDGRLMWCMLYDVLGSCLRPSSTKPVVPNARSLKVCFLDALLIMHYAPLLVSAGFGSGLPSKTESRPLFRHSDWFYSVLSYFVIVVAILDGGNPQCFRPGSFGSNREIGGWDSAKGQRLCAAWSISGSKPDYRVNHFTF